MPIATSTRTIAQLVDHATAELSPSRSARLDADLLLAYVLGCDRSGIYRDREVAVNRDHQTYFDELIRARARGQPVAQLLGTTEFWSLMLHIDSNVLIPRPETELLVEQALTLIPATRTTSICELGTGSGAISIAIAGERPHASIVASDRSYSALAVAQRNCGFHRIASIRLVCADWLASFRHPEFDLIVSNPPYVASGDALLSNSDIRFEPRVALVAGSDGFDALRTIASQAPSHLKPGGYLLLEHGYNQGAGVRTLLESNGFCDAHTETDLAGLERLTMAKRLPNET